MKVGSPEHMESVGWHPSVSWEERREVVRSMLEMPFMLREDVCKRLEAELVELDKGEDEVWPQGR